MMIMARVSPFRSSKVLGDIPTKKFPVSTIPASEKRERISSLKISQFSVRGEKSKNKFSNNHLSSSVQTCENSTSASGSVIVSCAGKRERSLGLLDGQEALKKQRLNKSTVMEKSVVKPADKVSKSKLGAATTTSCKGKRVSMNRNEYHRALLGSPRKQDHSRANHVKDQRMGKTYYDSSEGIAKFGAASAEAATWNKLKMEREREREAARLALEKMEKTVDIYESKEIIQEIEMLANRGYTMVNPLKMLGLFLKTNEYAEEED